jgi:UDP-glucose 4-epimerase
MESKVILVTGGLGYIGSHTIVELYKAGYNCIIVDNLYNASLDMIEPLETLTQTKLKYYTIDLMEKDKLEEVFKDNKIYGVIHFAAKKSVNESIKDPLSYYSNNLIGSVNLIDLCIKYEVNNFIFSSSACVYGTTPNPDEDSPLGAINPYGWTKIMIERVLIDTCNSNKYNKRNFRSVILRYCNPVSAHPSGLIFENPRIAPSNLFPVIEKHLRGLSEKLQIFGKDYNTNDGTAIRDYVHVTDIARGHVYALKWFNKEEGTYEIYNMGTDKGNSVLEVVTTYERVNNIKINYEFTARRDGDAEILLPKNSKIKRDLGWSADITLEDMCRDSYNWLSKYKNI